MWGEGEVFPGQPSLLPGESLLSCRTARLRPHPGSLREPATCTCERFFVSIFLVWGSSHSVEYARVDFSIAVAGAEMWRLKLR
jgi:hypothetical protein